MEKQSKIQKLILEEKLKPNPNQKYIRALQQVVDKYSKKKKNE
jgi:hypothetical protein|tara:strand:+ start:1522 stop:1650 length:129 start_codon:yes stop_codon:yes gene_type:complete